MNIQPTAMHNPEIASQRCERQRNELPNKSKPHAANATIAAYADHPVNWRASGVARPAISSAITTNCAITSIPAKTDGMRAFMMPND
jgi:hypothetical protein